MQSLPGRGSPPAPWVLQQGPEWDCWVTRGGQVRVGLYPRGTGVLGVGVQGGGEARVGAGERGPRGSQRA